MLTVNLINIHFISSTDKQSKQRELLSFLSLVRQGSSFVKQRSCTGVDLVVRMSNKCRISIFLLFVVGLLYFADIMPWS